MPKNIKLKMIKINVILYISNDLKRKTIEDRLILTQFDDLFQNIIEKSKISTFLLLTPFKNQIRLLN